MIIFKSKIDENQGLLFCGSLYVGVQLSQVKPLQCQVLTHILDAPNLIQTGSSIKMYVRARARLDYNKVIL